MKLYAHSLNISSVSGSGVKTSIFFLLSFVFFLLPYNTTAQGFNELIKAVASDRTASDNFGISVSLSGTFAIVGAYLEDEDTSGLNTMADAGAAYIFERDGSGNWIQVQKIVASDRAPGDYFGWSVSISGTVTIVGAYREDEDTSGVNTMSRAGSAYIFERDSSGNWNQVQKIAASDRDADDKFGISVSISGMIAIVAASSEQEDDTGGNTMTWAGSAYIFERDGSGNWNQVQKIVASDRDAYDTFGKSVSISGTVAIVGASYENEDASGVNSMADAGSAYIFERDGSGNWNQRQKIVASDRAEFDYFGNSVSISDTVAIVGVFKEDEDTSGLNTMTAAGSAYIFERDGSGNWNQVQKIVASDRDAGDYFGWSVSISGTVTIVGAYIEAQDTSGLNTMAQAGSAYIFKRDVSGNWNQLQKIVASDRAAGDLFGKSVSISGTVAIVGASREDEDASGLNTMLTAGSVYVFESSCGFTNSTQNITACDTYTVPSGDETYTTSGTYMDTILNAADCDSVITVNLTINNSTSSTINPTACSSYTSPSGNYIWTSSNTYTDTIPNAAGCDSLITVNLTINNSTSSTINPTVCNSYTSPSGNYIWTSTNTYTDTIPNAAGCDSLITVNLTINNSTSSTINPTVCNSYTSPSGNYIWTSTNTYTDTIPNAAGCDSVITVNLTINNSTSSTINPTACSSYTSLSGNYIWTSSNTYMDTIPNAAGCDSVITVNLTINTVDTSITQSGNTLTANVSGATYQWLDCDNGNAPVSGETNQSFTVTANGNNYAVEVTQKGCIDTSACYNITNVRILENDFGVELTVYPNPTEGSLTISFRQQYTNLNVKVRSITGQQVSTSNFGTTNKVIFEIEGAIGFYFIDITTKEGKTATLKVLKN